MITRSEIEATYQVGNGRITSPGKFEGQPIWVPYFWDKALEGWADDEAGNDPVFLVMPEDCLLFPELRGTLTLRLHEDSQGFVREVPVDNPVDDS
jgi:hypothetical protein